MKPLVLFAHGKESGPWGSKIKHLAEIAQRHGAKVLSPDYSDLADPDARVRRLLEMALIPHDRLVMVGSSMGAYVSTVASATLRPDGLFLMAPAFYMPGYAVQAPASSVRQTCVVVGWRDEVIPVEHSIRFSRAHRAELHVVDGDHRLNDVLEGVGVLFDRFLGQVLASMAPGAGRADVVVDTASG
jgi:predicted esterase